MNYFKPILVFLCTMTLFTSCQEVVEVDLDPAQPLLVIDAGIQWTKGSKGNQQRIKLTKLADYYASEITVVSEAVVSVSNSKGMIFDFIETPGTGEYVCTNFVPILGETYQLTIIVDGQTYSATEKLVSVPEITRIEQDENGGFLENEMEMTFFYTDDGNEENFYLTKFDTDFLPYPNIIQSATILIKAMKCSRISAMKIWRSETVYR